MYVSDINEDGEIEFWKLNRAMYGLKQAWHEWYKTLRNILEIAGLMQWTGDGGAYARTETTMSIRSSMRSRNQSKITWSPRSVEDHRGCWG